MGSGLAGVYLYFQLEETFFLLVDSFLRGGLYPYEAFHSGEAGALILHDERSAVADKIVQPRLFGGYEHDFDVLVDLVIDVSGACASTGWVYGLYAAHQWLVAGFPPEAQRDVWGEDPDAAVCGSYAPSGKAIAVPGGYSVTGRWAFASGCDGALRWA